MARLARMPAGLGMPVQYHQKSRMMTVPLDLTDAAVGGTSRLTWEAEAPEGTAVTVEVSLDGQTWAPCANGGSIPLLIPGLDLTGKQLLLRVTLATMNTAVTPVFHSLSLSLNHEEMVRLGVFWSTVWEAHDDTVEAIVTARDRLEGLRKSTYQSSVVEANTTLYDLAVAVLTDAGLKPSEYYVDPALQEYPVPYAWFDPVSHREAIRTIAEAALAQVYCDRDGVIRVEGPGGGYGADTVLEITPDDYERVSNPMRPDQVANEIVVNTQPLRPSTATEEIYRSNEPITVPAGQAATVTVYYSRSPAIDAAASLEGSGVIIAGATYYGWGAEVTLANSGSADASVSLVVTGRPLSVQNRERATARDEASIIDNGLIRYEFPPNHLVQSLPVAQQIADTILAGSKDARRDLEVDWRGNPALELGDRIRVKGREYHVIRQEIDWAGALSARTTGRRAT